MNYYLDITLLPDAEASLGFLWQKVYTQVHLSLVENKTQNGGSDIAVSFPKYGDKVFPLGDQLRLFAETKEQIIALDIKRWLSRLSDYSHIKSIKAVPEGVEKYAKFKRKQIKSNIEAKAARRAMHINKSYAEVLEYLLKENSKASNDKYHSDLPFINMESLSSDPKNKFPLFIERKLLDEPMPGEINCYGLSKTATVPWF